MTWFFASNAHGEKAIALDPDHSAQLLQPGGVLVEGGFLFRHQLDPSTV
jgi:hypothetical protein